MATDKIPASASRRADAVLDAVIAAVSETGEPDVQMSDVCARSGVALKTIYRYFTTKEQLLAAALKRWHSEVVRQTTGPVAERSLEGLATAFLASSAQAFAANLGMTRLMIRTLTSSSRYTTDTLQSIENEATEELTRYLACADPEFPGTLVWILHSWKLTIAISLARQHTDVDGATVMAKDSVAMLLRPAATIGQKLVRTRNATTRPPTAS
ncbi:TetR/AcrR family transcriptional regulator [Dactylosporangium sp. NPDC005572]|uniref:TetR/AcrR family transcriptional regulator n=1 Tax=Dactylosporangium sp. NPDC005572 TaxID=3156889 RepID=UPI0033A70488